MTPRAPRLASAAARSRITAIALAAIALFGAAIIVDPSDVGATPPNVATPVTATAVTAQTVQTVPPHPSTASTVGASGIDAIDQRRTTAAGASGATTEGAAGTQPEADSEPATATIVFATTPAVTAMVTWGRKRLGQIKPGKPLVVVRPRDSGPLDVVVRAQDYLPVQTRAHTFSDSRVLVKLTPLDKQSELLGYRAPLDAGVPSEEDTAAVSAIANSDAGVAPASTTLPVPPTPAPAAPTP